MRGCSYIWLLYTTMDPDQLYMRRCLELAEKASGYVAPNPMVGAVLVHNNKIIGEGYHQVYGGPHAEVNCLDSVPALMKHLVGDSTMYVSLEPCAHHGKTPPCADLIIRNNIPAVVIGCRDPFKEVDGKGIERLQAAGVKVKTGILEDECKGLNKRFFTFHTFHRPYIILKWSQTANGMIGHAGPDRLHITGSVTNHLVHKWRSEEASVMIGTNTAAADDPQLTNRLWSGPSPTRIIVDLDLKLSPSLNVFDGSARTIVFNTQKNESQNGVTYYKISRNTNLISQVIEALFKLKIISVLVEGGSKLLQSFINGDIWDEARIITNQAIVIQAGIASPVISSKKLINEKLMENDLLRYYIRN
jgi:diaminohydroxyphosphoribosylaminopyrimidine deaminase/5-amino-6-(5-phosphoribosylamino)uracil reductase